MRAKWVFVLGALAITAAPVAASAQVRTIDPNSAIDADLNGGAPPRPAEETPSPDEMAVDPGSQSTTDTPVDTAPPPATPAPAPAGTPAPATGAVAARTAAAEETYARDDLMTAAEGVFGKGAQGLAGMLERVLSEQGQPNASRPAI